MLLISTHIKALMQLAPCTYNLTYMLFMNGFEGTLPKKKKKTVKSKRIEVR